MSKVQTDFKVTLTRTELFSVCAPAKKGDTAAPETNAAKFADNISPIACASAAQDQKVQKVQTSSRHTAPQVQVISSSKPLRPVNCQDHALVSIMSFNCLISGAF